MDCNTGKIHEISDEEMKSWREGAERQFNEERKMVSLTEDEAGELKPMTGEKRKGWMRNKPCVCGSGKKFKRCCWNKFSD